MLILIALWSIKNWIFLWSGKGQLRNERAVLILLCPETVSEDMCGSQSDVEAAREAYDAFLSHYPYCYGYWRKYADYEKRKGSKKKCLEVCTDP